MQQVKGSANFDLPIDNRNYPNLRVILTKKNEIKLTFIPTKQNSLLPNHVVISYGFRKTSCFTGNIATLYHFLPIDKKQNQHLRKYASETVETK